MARTIDLWLGRELNWPAVRDPSDTDASDGPKVRS